MSRAPDIPRLVNFSDSDMSTDSDSDNEGKDWSSNILMQGNGQNSLVVDSNRSDVTEAIGAAASSDKEEHFPKEVSKSKEESCSKFSGNSLQAKYGGRTGEVKYGEGGSRDKPSDSADGRSRSWGRKRSVSGGRRSESRSRRSGSRDKRSGSRGRRSSSRDRSRSRGRRSSSGYRRSKSRGRRSSSRGRGGRSRSRSRERRRRSRSVSRGRYRRSRSGSRGKHRRSRSGSRRRRDRRHSSPGRRPPRRSPPRAHRTLDTLEKLGIELKPAAPPEEPQPSIPSYYNRLAVNPTKYAQQMAKKKLIWGCKTNEEGTAKASNWQGATFSQDQDGKMTAKFKRLMGIKGEEMPGTSLSTEGNGQELIKRQQELFSSMELQYEAARQATHTQRGVGLGFSSHPHHFPS